MRFNYDDNPGCATSIAVLITLILLIFIGPWVVQMGYNAVKLDFNLPDLNYWQFFWATNALQIIFKSNINSKSK